MGHFTLRNLGSAPLFIDKLEAGAGSDELRFDPGPEPLPWTLEGGEERQVTVTYTPTDGLSDSLFLNVETSDSFSPETLVTAVATGALYGQTHDRFEAVNGDSVVLSLVPLPSTLRVEVDGARMTTGWTYDASANAVLFATPLADSLVEVSYGQQPDCPE